MEFSYAVILDVALIVLVVLTMFRYKKRGFIAGIIDLVGNLVSLCFAWVFSGKVSPAVFDNFFKSGLITKTANTIQRQGGVNLDSILQDLSGFLPQSFIDEIVSSAQGLFDSNAPDVAQSIVENVIAPLIVPVITVAVFFVTYAVCKLLVTFLVAMLENVNRIPLVGGVNQLLGLVTGLIAGVINAILVLCLLWAVIAITGNNLPVLNEAALSGSYFFGLFFDWNPFL